MSIDVLSLDGEPFERGQKHGDVFADEVAANVDRYIERFNHYGIDESTAMELADDFASLIADEGPDYMAEMRGISEASGVPITEIALLNARYEVMYGAYAATAAEQTTAPDGCTSFAVQGEVTADGNPYLGQNWDWIPDVDVFVMRVSGDDVASHVAMTEAGIVGGKIGVNEHGIAMTLNGLVTGADGDNTFRLPYHVRFRRVLNSTRLSRAVDAVLKEDRACSANVLLGCDEGEFLNLEALPDLAAYISPDQGILTHANHLEKATDADSQFEELLPDTICRSPRLRRLLEQQSGSLSEQKLRETLQDHFDHPTSVCRHTDPEIPAAEQMVTRASAIISPTDRSLSITTGPPCENEYHTVTVTG